MKPRCSRCGSRPTHAQGLCMSCYQYERRNGMDRPWGLIVKSGERTLERRAMAQMAS